MYLPFRSHLVEPLCDIVQRHKQYIVHVGCVVDVDVGMWDV